MNDLKIEAEGDRSIRMTRTFHAPRTAVYAAWTQPELVRRWLLGPGNDWSMPICDIDLRVGGEYRYVWRNAANGAEMGMGGEFVEIDPPARIIATERFDESWYPGSAFVSTEFAEAAGETTLTQRVTYDSADARDGVLRSPMESGVGAGYDRLEVLLADRNSGLSDHG